MFKGKMFDFGLIIIIIIAAGAAIAGYSAYKISGKADGPVEEACETIIEDQLNMPDGSIDLSPETPEIKKVK